MDDDLRAAMIEASAVLNDFAAIDRVRVSILNAAHANNVRELQRHIDQCRELSRTLYTAAHAPQSAQEAPAGLPPALRTVAG